MREPIRPSVCAVAKRNTARSVRAVRMASSEYQGCPPRVVRGSARQARDRLVGEPDRQTPALTQAGVIGGPVRDLVLLPWNMAAAGLVQLERQGGYPRSEEGRRPTPPRPPHQPPQPIHAPQPRILPLPRDIHDDYGPVPSRLLVNADVGCAPILVMDGEHDLRIWPSWEAARHSSHADDGAPERGSTQSLTAHSLLGVSSRVGRRFVPRVRHEKSLTGRDGAEPAHHYDSAGQGVVGDAGQASAVLDVADVVVLHLLHKIADRHVFDHAPAQRADGRLGHRGAPVLRTSCEPLDPQDGTAPAPSPVQLTPLVPSTALRAALSRESGFVLWHNPALSAGAALGWKAAPQPDRLVVRSASVGQGRVDQSRTAGAILLPEGRHWWARPGPAESTGPRFTTGGLQLERMSRSTRGRELVIRYCRGESMRNHGRGVASRLGSWNWSCSSELIRFRLYEALAAVEGQFWPDFIGVTYPGRGAQTEKRPRSNPEPPSVKLLRWGWQDLEVHSAAHTTAAWHGRSGLFLRSLRDHRLCGDQEARHRSRALQSRAHDLRRIDNAGLDQVDELL